MQDSKAPPKTIEEVPFRRQDRRILNSRKKRLMDRKLIRCILLMGLILIVVGGALVALWWQVEAGKSPYVCPQNAKCPRSLK